MSLDEITALVTTIMGGHAIARSIALDLYRERLPVDDGVPPWHLEYRSGSGSVRT